MLRVGIWVGSCVLTLWLNACHKGNMRYVLWTAALQGMIVVDAAVSSPDAGC